MADSTYAADSLANEEQRKVVMEVVEEGAIPISAEVVQEAPTTSNQEIKRERRLRIDKGAFMPDPKRATWYSIVCPGLGQIYNRSYWKLPIVYGGMLACTY